MKLLLDLLPVILFFAAYMVANSDAEGAARFATEHFGFAVSGGSVAAAEAPVLLATIVVIVATMLQIAWLLVRGRKVDTMLWATFAIVTVLGGATVWFHDATFIKWKPSVLYWAMSLGFWASAALFGKNLLQTLVGDQLRLPAPAWKRLNLAWVAFFALMGFVNLYVAYNYSTSTWVTFKLFGLSGLMLVFMIAQGYYMMRHAEDDEVGEAPPAAAVAATRRDPP